MADFVIAGGGSAGSALAGRLAEAGAKVLLLEAGPRDSHPLIHIPAGFVKLLDSKLLYHYQTERQEALNGRAPIMPQGNVLGGGSSVNAAIYIRVSAAIMTAGRRQGQQVGPIAMCCPIFAGPRAMTAFRTHGMAPRGRWVCRICAKLPI